MACLSSNFPFLHLCELFTSITKCRDNKDKYSKLHTFFYEYRAKGEEALSNTPDLNVSLFPIIRLFLPELDRDRTSYNIGEHHFGKILSSIWTLPPQDKKYIEGYWKKQPVANIVDFADAVCLIFTKYMASSSTKLSVFEVNDFLDKISKAQRNEQKILLNRLLQKVTPEELKWLVRIILKKVPIGVGHKKILNIFHKDAESLFDLNNNLELTCKTLHDSKTELTNMEITLFKAVRPMLSQRVDAKEFRKSVTKDRKFHLETKFDGERFQLHMKDGKFQYFSRRGFDFTSAYGKDFTTGLFTPSLIDVFDPSVTSIILDGEMMGWNTKTKQFGSKGMTFDVKKLTENNLHKPCLCVFDMLLVNDEILTSQPLKNRQEQMKSVLKPKEGVLQLSQYREVTSAKEIIADLNESVDQELEGIVFKDPESLYKPNARNAGWWKMKLEYFEDTMNDLDVLILGGYYGEGRNRCRITGFLIGIAEKPDQDSPPDYYYSMGKLTTGLNDEELALLDRKLGSHWKPVKANDKEHESHRIRWGKETPDFWIPPEKSCVLQVRGTELTKVQNNDFMSSYTLRFPRIQRIRPDKFYQDILTTIEVEALTSGNKNVEKLSKRHLKLSDLDEPPKKQRVHKNDYKAPVLVKAERKNNLLAGLEFYILKGSLEWPKNEVEKEIQENGGTIVLFERPSVFCILSGGAHPRIDMYKGDKDIVKLDWLKRVIDSGRFKRYGKSDLFFESKKTQLQMASEQDKYGDSYTEKVKEEVLEQVIRNIKDDYINLTKDEKEDIYKAIHFVKKDDELTGCTAYFDRHEVINDPASGVIFRSNLEEFEFVYRGGTVSDLLNAKDVDMIIAENQDGARTLKLRTFLQNEDENNSTPIVDKRELMNFMKSNCD